MLSVTRSSRPDSFLGCSGRTLWAYLAGAAKTASHLSQKDTRMANATPIWTGLRAVSGTMLYTWVQVAWALPVAVGLLFMLTDLVDGYGWGVAVLVVAVLNWGAYWWGHHITLMHWARHITGDQNAYVHSVASEQAQLAGLPMPRVIESQCFTAFVIGRSPRHAVLGVSSTLQCRLGRREFGAVIAHEMAHVKNRDALVGTVAMTVVGVVVAVSILVGIYGWLGAIVLLLPVMSWLREFHADTTGANVCGDPVALASALKKLPRGSFLSATLYLPFVSHPPTMLRVWNLRG